MIIPVFLLIKTDEYIPLKINKCFLIMIIILLVLLIIFLIFWIGVGVYMYRYGWDSLNIYR